MSLDLTMKALADEVRALSGTTEDKSIELMTSDVNAANVEILRQAELLAQIITVLESKTNGEVVEERLEGDGQEFYTMAPSTLSFRSTAPLNELQDVRINGQTVDPANYTLEEGSTIVKLKYDYLSTLDVGQYELSVVSNSKTVKGDFTVAAPELNEYGFYYNTPYSREDLILLFHDNNTMTLYFYLEGWSDYCEYTIEDSKIIFEWEDWGITTLEPQTEGAQLRNMDDGSIWEFDSNVTIVDSDYIYVYNDDISGYEVLVIDKSKTSYGVIKPNIKDVPVLKIAGTGFENCYNLTTFKIPEGIQRIGGGAFSCCGSLRSIELPNSLTTVENYAFDGCDNLEFSVYDNLRYLGTKNNPYTCLVQVDPFSDTQITYDIHEDTKVISSYVFVDSSIEYLTIPKNVQYINEFAFMGTNLGTIDFSSDSKLKEIGTNAFSFTSLTNIELPASLLSIGTSALSMCSLLESVVISGGSLNICDYAFDSCSSLVSVTIEDCVVNIAENVFADCESLTDFCISDIATWCNINGLGRPSPATYNIYINGESITDITELVIPDGVTTIRDSAFKNCSALTSVTVGNNVKSIGNSAFYYCSSLTSVSIGNSVKSIGESAFTYCSSLTSITIPNSVISIGNWAFSSCTSLMNITIPDNVSSINGYTFQNCSSLTSIIIPDSVESIGVGAFSGCTSLQYNAYDNAYYLGNEINPYVVLVETKSKDITSCSIHNDTKIIHSYAFSSCHGLTSVTIGNSVTSIGGAAFEYCSGLTNITIPDSVTSIDYHAFLNCVKLTSVTIGNSVTSIGSEAFEYCIGLRNVYYTGTTAQWNAITKKSDWNQNVPATHVQCSDGQVAI